MNTILKTGVLGAGVLEAGMLEAGMVPSVIASPGILPPEAAPASLRSPFDALRWNAQDLADAVPLRLHVLFADGLPLPANDARVAAPRRWHQGYLRRRDLPALVRIHN